MSIWCSRITVGWEDEGESVGGKVIDDNGIRDPQPHWVGGEIRSYAEGWSNHYPNPADHVEMPAGISLAHIAPFCVPGNDEADEGDGVGPWLRLGIESPLAVTLWGRAKKGDTVPDPQHAAVILDDAAARALVRELRRWIKSPKVNPKGVGHD